MNMTTSFRRLGRAALPLLALTVVALSAADVATSAPPTAAIHKFAACVKTKGFTFPPSEAQRANAKYQTAAQACAKKVGLNPRGAAPMQQNAKYVACMSKHGITISRTSRPNRSSATFKKADAACASLRS
jgi:hypothetical protein